MLDLDGLLIDSETWSWQAHNEALARFNAAPLSLQDVQRLIGLDSDDEWVTLTAMRRLLADRDGYRVAQGAAFVAIRDRSLAPMPGVAELLDVVAAQGLRLGLASNSHRSSVIQALDGLGIRDRFGAIVSADDVAEGKPAPDVYLRALTTLGLSAGDALAVEDSPIGVTAACAAGLFCVAVPNRLTAALDLNHAHARMESLREVARSLKAGESPWSTPPVLG